MSDANLRDAEHWHTEGVGQQRLEKLSASGWEKKHQIRDRWRRAWFSKTPCTRDVFVYFFLSHNYPVIKHEWENPTHCWHRYEWVTVLEFLQRTDFCFGEVKRLCKAAAVKAIIRMALVPAMKSKAWSGVSWSRPHQAPPAASPVQNQQQFWEDSLAHSLFLCTEHLLQQKEPEQCQVGFFVHTLVHICTHKHFVTVIRLHFGKGCQYFCWSSWKEK